jgi:spermidine synthase
MSARLEELDWGTTPIGDLSLRRRRDPLSGVDVYEVKLDDDFLMSSLFTVAEIAVATLALAEITGEGLDVVVGGLGLGYTAQAVLQDPRVASLVVVERLEKVIEWHERGLLPVGQVLSADPRNTFVLGDFFSMTAGTGYQSDQSDDHQRFHAIIVDIDHSPRHLLHPSHADFYEVSGLRRVADHLHPGGVFALWSNDPPDDEYLERLESVFTSVRADVVAFDNPLQGGESTNTVFLGIARA